MSRSEKSLSRFNRIILWLNYALILCLLLSISAKYISPALFWIPAFFGLGFPILFLLNLLFLVYWLIQFKKAVLFSFIALLLCVPTVLRFVQISTSNDNKGVKTFKVASFNCMLFDLYNWTGNREARNNILQVIEESNPDILCLQEFYTSEDEGDFHNIDTLKHILRTENFHTEFTTTLREHDHWGVATFSKFPIVNRGKILFNTNANNICIFTDIILNKDTVRIYNVHLQSISFSRKDNKFLEDVMNKNSKDGVENSKNILRRLKRAFLKRTTQVEMIKAHMKTCPYKIFVCGDFNDTPSSYAYSQLSANLNDAFIEEGKGFGKTYAGKWPQFRIDYILHDKDFDCVKFERAEETFTDHYLITASFKK